jgi:hypothetical protein
VCFAIGLSKVDVREKKGTQFMMRTLLAAVTILALSVPARAIDRADEAFVVMLTTTLPVTGICKGFDVDPDGMGRWSNKNGVDGIVLVPAVKAAVASFLGEPYDKTKLVPAVTKIVRSILPELGRNMEADLPGFCKEWVKELLDINFIKRSN